MDFTSRILSWYERNHRDLPWRSSTDPYVIWVSEVILQQTRMMQGLVFYARFIAAFPDVFSLASASEDKVLRTWQGFGYYSRARRMHATAREIVQKYGGQFPQTSAELIQLQGVGHYTAAAIASIAFGEAIPAIDGNVIRVFARLFAMRDNMDAAAGKKSIFHIADTYISRQHPGAFNQALMDFGSVVCKPQRPDCKHCLFSRECLALKQDAVDKYPVRSPKKHPTTRHFTFFLFLNKAHQRDTLFFVKQRTGNDIWKNLYDLPGLETPAPLTPEDIPGTSWWKSLLPGLDNLTLCSEMVRIEHKLTHQQIHAAFLCIEATEAMCQMLRKQFVEVSPDDFEDMPKPILIKNYLERYAFVALQNRSGKQHDGEHA